MTARRNNEWRGKALRMLTGVMLAAGVFAATSRPANAATTARFNNGVLTVFGDAATNTIGISRDAAGVILINGGAVPVGGGIADGRQYHADPGLRPR